jgi:hypothetical protein
MRAQIYSVALFMALSAVCCTANVTLASGLRIRHDASSAGLIDLSGKELTPRKYTSISPLIGGCFEAREPNEGDCTKRSQNVRYLNSTGAIIARPNSCKYLQMGSDFEMTKLVNGTVCSEDGKKLFALPAGMHTVEKHGPIFVCYESPQLFIHDQPEAIICMDSSGHELFRDDNVIVTSLSWGATGIIALKKPGLDGRGPTTIVGLSGVLFRIEQNTDGVLQLTDRIMGVVDFDRKFCSALWTETTSANKKMLQFANFLEEHNVIGMSRHDLVEALGMPDPNGRYFLSGNLKSPYWESLDFVFKNDRVEGWFANNSDLFHDKSHVSNDPDGLGVVSDVVFQRNYRGELFSCPYRFVGKSRLTNGAEMSGH